MGYKGVATGTKIHYSNKILKYYPLCKIGYITTEDWDKVTCKKCLNKRNKK